MSSIATQTEKVSKRLPTVLIEILEVAIFSFASLSGLKSSHKVRGDPVLKGVCALFGSFLSCAKEDVIAEFERIRTGCPGGWKPGNEPTKELLPFISSWMKNVKSEKLKTVDGPEIPNLLIKTKETYQEETERIVQRHFPPCWICDQRCCFCRLKRKHNIPTFWVE